MTGSTTRTDKSVEIEAVVNGDTVRERISPRRLLSDFLRHDLGLTGTHVGCEHGVCGCCTVVVDDVAVRSCLMLAGQIDGATVETIEGLAAAGEPLNSVQKAFQDQHAMQCGFCTPGFVMVVQNFLETRAASVPLSREEAREAISGNLCRCTGYQHIVEAVLQADRTIRERDAREDAG